MGLEMSILFDVGHPADLYMFNAVMQVLRQRGVESHLLLRNRDINYQLASSLNIDYIPGSTQKRGLKVLTETFPWLIKTLSAIRTKNVRLIVSAGNPVSALSGLLCGIPHIAFNDTDTLKYTNYIFSMLSRRVYTPESALRSYGKKHVRYKGIHDLTYLDARRFKVDRSVLAELGLKEGEKYAVLRFVCWSAFHDIGKQSNIEEPQKVLVEKLEQAGYRVFISDEGGTVNPILRQHILKIPPHRFHHLLAFASLVAGDGASTASEAAVLGVPSIYISPFANALGDIRLLRENGLIEVAETFEDAYEKIEKLIEPGSSNRDKLEKFLADCVDVAEYMADRCIENMKK